MFNSLSTLLDSPSSPSIVTNPNYPESRDIWGPKFWGTLHNIAASYPDNPTRTQKKKMRELIAGLIDNIPCSECKSHAKEYMKHHKIRVTSKEKLSKDLCSFHNTVNSRLGKKEVDCNLILRKSDKVAEDKEECESCKLTVRDTPNIITQKIDYSDYKNSVIRIIKDRCKEAGVAEPVIIFGECPTDKERSCTQVNLNTKEGAIYINNNTASLRSVLHESEHWIRAQRGEIESTKDEVSVDNAARSLITHDDYVKLEGNRSLVTLADSGGHEGGSGIFSHIDAFYKPLSDLTNLDASHLNDANTPEIIGYALDALGDMTLTPFGNALANVATGLGLVGISILIPELGKRDKIFFNELGAHKIWSIIRYANPKTNAVAYQQAAAVGQALSTGNFAAITSNIIQTATPPPLPAAAAVKTVPVPATVLQSRGVNTPASMKTKGAFYINQA